MLVLIGNARNSGSTFLADLVDSHPFGICGPEIELFSNPKLYASKFHAASLYEPFSTFAAHRPCMQTYYNRLYHYDLSLEEIARQRQECKNTGVFSRWFESHCQNVNRKNNAVVFEKSPGNTNTIEEFLKSSSEHYYVHVVRNPLQNMDGILRRNPGISRFLAACIWILEESKFYRWRNHRQVKIVRYEDLLKNPFGTVSKIISDFGGSVVRTDDFRRRYENNLKKGQYGHKNWSIVTHEETNPAECIVSDEAKKLIKVIYEKKVDERYRKLYGLSDVTMRICSEEYGYDDDIQAATGAVAVDGAHDFDWLKALPVLLNKWGFEARGSLIALRSFNAYINVLKGQ